MNEETDKKKIRKEIYRAYYSEEIGEFQIPSFLGPIGCVIRENLTKSFTFLNQQMVMSQRFRRLFKFIIYLLLLASPILFWFVYATFSTMFEVVLIVMTFLQVSLLWFLIRQIRELYKKDDMLCKKLESQKNVYLKNIKVNFIFIQDLKFRDYNYIEIVLKSEGEFINFDNRDDYETFRITYNRRDLLRPKLYEYNSIQIENIINDIYNEFRQHFIVTPSFFHIKLIHILFILVGIAADQVFLLILGTQFHISLLIKIIVPASLIILLLLSVYISDKRLVSKLNDFIAQKEKTNVYDNKFLIEYTWSEFFKPVSIEFTMQPDLEMEAIGQQNIDEEED